MDQLTQEDAQKIWDELDNDEAAPAAEAVEIPAQVDEPKDETATQPEAAKAAPAAPAEDPYAGMSTAAKDELIGLKSLVSQLSQRVRNTEGHIGGIKSQLTSAGEAAKQVRAEVGVAPSAAELREAQSDPAAFQQLRKDYPEFAEAIDGVVQHRINASISKLKPEASAPGVSREEIEGAMNDFRDQIERETYVEINHRGWKSVVKTPEFVGWFEQQPREVRTLAGSTDPADAVRMLDLFSESRGRKVNQATRLEAAAAIPSGRQSGVKVKSVDDMTPEEYWAHLDAKERAAAR